MVRAASRRYWHQFYQRAYSRLLALAKSQ